ncbi:MAG: DUF5320 domain-containing protein [Bacteroidales bacterium]|nr:DUF5320 domain-containing protein [Bacteroidales bacterium]
MPGGDRSGPMGQGPVTGRGLGFCTGYESAGFTKGAGYGSGRRFGMGRGMRFGMGGGGRGFGRFGAFGYNPTAMQAYPQVAAMNKEDEIRLLKSQAEDLSRSQRDIEKRLKDLEKEG